MPTAVPIPWNSGGRVAEVDRPAAAGPVLPAAEQVALLGAREHQRVGAVAVDVGVAALAVHGRAPGHAVGGHDLAHVLELEPGQRERRDRVAEPLEPEHLFREHPVLVDEHVQLAAVDGRAVRPVPGVADLLLAVGLVAVVGLHQRLGMAARAAVERVDQVVAALQHDRVLDEVVVVARVVRVHAVQERVGEHPRRAPVGQLHRRRVVGAGPVVEPAVGVAVGGEHLVQAGGRLGLRGRRRVERAVRGRRAGRQRQRHGDGQRDGESHAGPPWGRTRMLTSSRAPSGTRTRPSPSSSASPSSSSGDVAWTDAGGGGEAHADGAGLAALVVQAQDEPVAVLRRLHGQLDAVVVDRQELALRRAASAASRAAPAAASRPRPRSARRRRRRRRRRGSSAGSAAGSRPPGTRGSSRSSGC